MFSPFQEENVDYLNFPFKEEDCTLTWNFLIKSKQSYLVKDSLIHELFKFENENNLASLPRLENAVWRRWSQQKFQLSKHSSAQECFSLLGPLITNSAQILQPDVQVFKRIHDDFNINLTRQVWKVATTPKEYQSMQTKSKSKTKTKHTKLVRFNPKIGRIVFEKEASSKNLLLVDKPASQLGLEEEKESFSSLSGEAAEELDDANFDPEEHEQGIENWLIGIIRKYSGL